MSNYTIDNLIPTTTGNGRIPAIKIGGQVFPMHVYGNSGYFYKCASVDTASQTWTGYRALLTNGVYSFMPTVTTGLTYSVVTPVVGNVYADGALVEAKLWSGIPTDGLIRYAPMSAAASDDDLGYGLQVGGSPSFAVDSGIGCAEMTDSFIGYQNAPTDLSAYTLSIWMKRLTGGAFITFSGGSYGPGGNEIWINYNDTGLISISNGAAEDADIIITDTTYTGWQHIAVVWTGSAFRLYIDGSQYGSDTQTEYYTSWSTLYPYINSLQRATFVKGTGKYAAFRLYDRVLSAFEIAALAAEFTPAQE